MDIVGDGEQPCLRAHRPGIGARGAGLILTTGTPNLVRDMP
jgi:hypothetical protein